jgi:hypothetical protein
VSDRMYTRSLRYQRAMYHLGRIPRQPPMRLPRAFTFPMRAHTSFMRFLVWNMRWATRYAGFAVRPMVRAYASVEVIACGLRERDARVAIMYSPAPGRTDYHARLYDHGRWRPVETVQMADFTSPSVHRVLIPRAHIGQRYRMRAKNRLGWSISSPTITVKEATIYEHRLLTITPSSDATVTFSWVAAETYDPMVYFLAVEDAVGVNQAAIYTREVSWTYPWTRAASLSLGPARPPGLIRGETYAAKLVLVDYHGWVSHIAEQGFAL